MKRELLEACDEGNLLRVQQLCRDVDASNIRYLNLFSNTPLHEAARYVLYSPYHFSHICPTMPSISRDVPTVVGCGRT